MISQKKKKPKVLSLQDWVIFGIIALIIGGSLFIQIATTINPNFSLEIILQK